MNAAELPRLLIVDDEVPLMRALQDALAGEGYRTQGFSSARQALASVQAGAYDLLLTDLMMPEMDGISLIAAVQQVDKELGAIVMTGHGTIDTAVEAMRGGALDYVLKPFKLSAIVPVISRALDVRRLRRENALLLERERQHAEQLAIAYQDLEAFTYSISHDLRAPLRAIEGFARMLDEDFSEQLGEEGRRIARVVRDSSGTMDGLIVGLLAFSRVGKQTLAPTAVDMTALAKDAAAAELRSYRGPEPELEIDALPPCSGDATVLRQVWCNLIGNALKYSAKRSRPHVHVSGRSEPNEHIYQVQDNGAGFDMRYAEKLFGVFQRLHRAEEFDGTGVGLAIVQRIITRHRGRIWAEGAPDAGACFHFALPVGEEP